MYINIINCLCAIFQNGWRFCCVFGVVHEKYYVKNIYIYIYIEGNMYEEGDFGMMMANANKVRQRES